MKKMTTMAMAVTLHHQMFHLRKMKNLASIAIKQTLQVFILIMLGYNILLVNTLSQASRLWKYCAHPTTIDSLAEQTVTPTFTTYYY